MQYRFPIEKCSSCGQKLSRKVRPEEIPRGPIPMGRCLECGTVYTLVEIEPKPVKEAKAAEAAPEPEPETPPEPES